MASPEADTTRRPRHCRLGKCPMSFAVQARKIPMAATASFRDRLDRLGLSAFVVVVVGRPMCADPTACRIFGKCSWPHPFGQEGADGIQRYPFAFRVCFEPIVMVIISIPAVHRP